MLFRPLFRIRRVGPARALPTGGVILCANHQSYLDPALIQLVVRRRLVFMMTNDFYEIPFARAFFMLCGAIPVELGSRRARASMVRAGALLRMGRAVVVFPEGRLSPPGVLGRVQRGIGVLARTVRAPVVPIAVAGASRAWPKGARRFRLANVRVAIGEPIVYEGPADRAAEQAFADRVRERIASLWAAIPAPTA